MKFKHVFFCFFLALFSCQNNKHKIILDDNLPDTLWILLEKADKDSFTYKQRHSFNNRALILINQRQNDSLKRKLLFKVAARYYNMSAMDDYKLVTQQIITASTEERDSLSLAKANSFLGDYYGYKFISDSAYYYYLNAEKIYTAVKDYSNSAKALLNKAIIQFNEGDFVGCEKSAIEALKFLRYDNDDLMSYEAYNILGTVHGELNEFKKSIEYHSKAISIAEQNNIFPQYHAKSTSLNNLGHVYKNMRRYDRAVKYFNLALLDKRIFTDKTNLYASLQDNLAYSKFKMRDFDSLPGRFFKALNIRDSLKIIPGIISSKLNLSEFYSYKKDTTSAYKFANEAYILAKENSLPKDLLFCLKQLSEVNKKKSVHYSKEYIKINDSLQLTERQARNKLARIEYETEELTLEKDKLVEQRKTLIYIALGILVLGTLVFMIRLQITKNRELVFVQEQQKANEEIYQLMINQQDKAEEVRQGEKKRIAQELHDGVLGKLFGTRMNLGVLNDNDDSDSKSKRVRFIDELKTLEQEIREISHDLNSEKSAVANNFVVMVSNFVETQSTVCKAAISLFIDPKINWNEIDSLAKINFYRILQEAFQNINKHSNAKTVSVSFEKIDNEIRLHIKDDGIGFVYSKKKKGIGLQNMLSRITRSGGTMVIDTEPDNGTLLKFQLPLS